MSTPQKINVIEYKGQLFRTQEEYSEFRKNEIRQKAVELAGSHEELVDIVQHLLDSAINTKTKMEDFIKEVNLELENLKEDAYVNNNSYDENDDIGDEKEDEAY